ARRGVEQPILGESDDEFGALALQQLSNPVGDQHFRQPYRWASPRPAEKRALTATIDTLATKGRIVVVGTGAGADARLPLSKLWQTRLSPTRWRLTSRHGGCARSSTASARVSTLDDGREHVDD